MFTRPRRVDLKLARDMTVGVFLLLSVSAFSVFVGLFLTDTQLGNWGQWIGAFIAGIAMIGSAYAIILQSRQGESLGWNIALTRLGEIYDQACINPRLATIINQGFRSELENRYRS